MVGRREQPVKLTSEELQPFLTPNPLRAKQKTLVDAWAPVLAALLNARFGAAITEELEPVFVSAAATAVQRRLDKTNQMISSQSVNGAAVTYSASLKAWFYPGELAELSMLLGRGGVRSYRMSAPPGVTSINVHKWPPEGSNGF